MSPEALGAWPLGLANPRACGGAVVLLAPWLLIVRLKEVPSQIALPTMHVKTGITR